MINGDVYSWTGKESFAHIAILAVKRMKITTQSIVSPPKQRGTETVKLARKILP